MDLSEARDLGLLKPSPEFLSMKETRYQSKNWDGYLLLFSSHERLDGLWRVFMNNLKEVGTKEMERLILETYQHTDFTIQNRRCWDLLLGFVRDSVFSDSGGPIPVSEDTEIYRGYQAKPRSRIMGYSWTLDKDKALWFARRFPLAEGQCRYLATTTVNPSKIKGYLVDRDEAEIVLLPEDARLNMRREKVGEA